MIAKPTYEELERRVQDLEKSESERNQGIGIVQEGQYRWLVENANELILVAQDGLIRFVNRKAFDYLGYSPEELKDRPFIQYIHPEDREKVSERHLRRLKGEDLPGIYPFRVVDRDGKARWMEINAVLSEWNGKPATLNYINDITERKRAEEELQRYEWIIEKEMPWADTKDSGFESAYGDITEYNRKRLILDGVKKENLEHMAADVMALLDTSLAVYEANGDYAYGIFKSSWCQNLDSAAFKLSGTNDVKKALSSGKWLCHDNCWNDSAKAAIDSGNPTDIECVGGIRLYAVPVFARNEIIGVVNIGYGNPPKDNETLIKLSKKFNISFDLLRAKADAYKPRPNFIVELGKTRCQQMARMIGEIIESRQAELEKEKLQAQLTQAQKMESVGRLAGGVAHDFNNMLGVILGHTELALERAEENSDICSDLKEIQTAAQRSADLTKQLLTFARKQIIEPKMLNLNQTIKQMTTMLQRLIGEDIDVLWKPCEALWPVKMDPSQIDQILANLCVNARDAITDVGKITIETDMVSFDEAYCVEHAGFIPGDFVLLGVSDNGSGMDKETLNNLFEPFFTTKEMGKGTGLGLATVYGIVKQNNGFINVYSEPGQGTTFKIYLPRHTAVDQTAPVIHTEQQYPGGNETILLVEDEPAILNMVRMMLERKGYSVLSAATTAEAIALAKIHADKIHLLMTDVVMPEMNGRDLARHLIAIYPDIKLLFMSGYTANVIAHQGVLDEGVSFIQKPFSRSDLFVKLRSVLDR
jgi:PAS domain S-box-containing protein